MPKLWKKTGDAKNNSDLSEVDTSKPIISGPTLVFFPGQITPDDNPANISKDLNDVKNIFRDLPNPPQVYLWSHPEDTERTRALAPRFRAAVYKLSLHKISVPTTSKDLTSFFRLVAYNSSFHRSSTPIARDLTKSLIMPLVSNTEGKRLSFEEAQKNIRNLTFLGYCMGGYAAQGVYNAARKMLRKAGYSRKETRKLLREIVLVTFGTISEPKKEDHRYTTISLIYNDDTMLRAKNRLWHPLSRAFSRSSPRLKVKQLSKSSILVSATLMGKKRDQHKETQKEVIENVHLRPWRKKAFNHFLADYVNSNDKSSQFSRIVQYALINAINRKDTVRPVDLLAPPAAQEKTPEITRYERKIAKALRA